MCSMTAIERLDVYVKGELRYLVDNNLPLKSYSMDNMLSNIISKEEAEGELKNCLQQLNNGNVAGYCACRGIDIPKQ